jgi:hypothetical protein
MWFNPIVTWLLRSPLHGLISKGTMLVTVTGCKTCKPITTPTNYQRDGDSLWVVSWRERTWWRNLRGGAPVKVLLAGREESGDGLVIEEKGEVAKSLCDYVRRAPQMASYFNIKTDKSGQPNPMDCEAAAEKMVMVRIDLVENPV